MRPIALIGLVLLWPTALASGEFQIGPIRAQVINSHAEDCLDPLYCVAEARTSSVESAELDARQEIYRVRVVVDLGFTPHQPYPLLSGEELVLIDESDGTFEHATIAVVQDLVGTRQLPYPAQHFGVNSTRDGFFVNYYGIAPHRANENLGPERFGGNYTGGYLGYGRVGPVNNGENISTDAAFASNVRTTCEIAGAGCPHGEEAIAAYETIIPNVRWTLEFHAVIVDPVLADEAAIAAIEREHAGEPLSRVNSAALAEPAVQSSPPGPLSNVIPTAETQERVRGPAPDREPVQMSERSQLPAIDIEAPIPLALTLAASFALSLVAKLLYSRFRSREDALQHELRQRVLDLVGQAPRTIGALARELNVDRSTALYHARVLKRTRVVVLAKVQHHHVVALPGQDPAAAVPKAEDGAAREILDLLREAGGVLPRAELHRRAAAIPLRTRNHVMRELADHGKIERAFRQNEEVVRLAG